MEQNQTEPPSTEGKTFSTAALKEGVPPIMEREAFHDVNKFNFIDDLETNWKVIKQEFEAIQKSLFHPWPEAGLFRQNGQEGSGWDVFGLYACKISTIYAFLTKIVGKKHFRNAKLAPETTKIVERIPGVSTAVPHVGYYGYSEMVLRCHLGIIIPEKRELCWLQVADQRRHWEEGKCLVFDDTFCHSAVNNTDESRVILLLDFSGVGPKPKKIDKNTGEEIIEEETHPDQTDYLDQMTSMYGYGQPENENGEDP